MQLTFRDKDLFLDRAKVQQAILAAGQDPARLNRAGALVRREARQSMRVAKKKSTVSAPGTPPRARQAEPNLRTIYYAWDPALKSLVVGAVSFGRQAGAAVPGLHEHGGTVRMPLRHTIVKRKARSGRKPTRKQLTALKRLTKQRKFFGISETKQKIVMRSVTYPPRPFMGPALARIAPKLPDLWAGSVVDRSASLTSGAGPVAKSA